MEALATEVRTFLAQRGLERAGGPAEEHLSGISLGRDDALEEGEVYLNLSLRIFLAGLCEEVLELALENLRAAREALGEEFP